MTSSKARDTRQTIFYTCKCVNVFALTTPSLSYLAVFLRGWRYVFDNFSMPDRSRRWKAQLKWGCCQSLTAVVVECAAKKKKGRISRAGGFWGEGEGGEAGGASDIMRLNNTGKARAMETAGSFCPFPGTRCRQRCTRSDLFFTEQLGRCFSFNGCYL